MERTTNEQTWFVLVVAIVVVFEVKRSILLVITCAIIYWCIQYMHLSACIQCIRCFKLKCDERQLKKKKKKNQIFCVFRFFFFFFCSSYKPFALFTISFQCFFVVLFRAPFYGFFGAFYISGNSSGPRVFLAHLVDIGISIRT